MHVKLAGGAALPAPILLGLSLFAWQQWQREETALRVTKTQNLAAQAQIAFVTSPLGEALDTVATERGALLPPELLDSFPTVVLRAGLRKRPGPPLEIPVAEEEDLAGAGPEGSWIFLDTEGGARIFDPDARTYRDASPAEESLLKDLPEKASSQNRLREGTRVLWQGSRSNQVGRRTGGRSLHWS